MSVEPRTQLGSRSSRHQRTPEQHMRRSALLTLLGAVVPGAGLTRTRHARLGWLLLLLAVIGLVGLVGVILVQGPYAAAVAVGVRPKALLAVAVALVGGGLIWAGTVALTYRASAHPSLRPRQRTVLRAWTGVLCLAILLPMAVGARYSLIQRDVVSSVFGGDVAGDGTDRVAPVVGASDPWAGVGRITMLLLGSDAGDDRVGTRTDSMILASIDTQTGKTLLFSLPRNLEKVPFPKDNPLYKLYPSGYNCGDQCLLNGVWTLAEDHRDLFPSSVRRPGLTTLQGVITEITGLRIDYTTIIDLKGFEALVDAMGGVTVTVSERLPVQGYMTSRGLAGVEEWIEPGVRHLDGYHALWFARSRLASDDYSRMRRQRCLVGKIINQVNPAVMLQKYPLLARVAQDNITTDVPAEHLPAWVELIDRIKSSEIQSLPFTELNVSPGNPDFPAIRRMVREALDPSLVTASKTTRPSSASPSTPTRSSTSTGTSTKSTPFTPTKPTEDHLVNVEDAC